jgi:hypothetical protein
MVFLENCLSTHCLADAVGRAGGEGDEAGRQTRGDGRVGAPDLLQSDCGVCVCVAADVGGEWMDVWAGGFRLVEKAIQFDTAAGKRIVI